MHLLHAPYSVGIRDRIPRRVSVHARHPADDVPRPVVDDAAVRRLRHGRRIERPVPLFARPRRQRIERGLRSADADGIRLRSSARRWGSGQGRRRDRLDRGHGGALRQDSARSRVDVDDDQFDRHHSAGALRVGRAAPGRGAGRAVGPGGNNPERHPEGVRRPRHVHLPAAPFPPHRHRHLRVLRARAAQLEHDFDQRLPHPRGRFDGGAGSGVHLRARDRVRRGGDRRGVGRQHVRPARIVFLQRAQ